MSKFEKSGRPVWMAGLVAAGISVGCNRKDAAEGPPEMPPPVVVTVSAKAEDVPVYLDGIGKIAAVESATIMPRMAGLIVARSFEDGSTVKKHQVLFQLDAAPFEAELARAEAEQSQRKAAVEFAKIELDRYAAVAGTKAISKADHDTKKNALDLANAELAAANAGVQTAKINLDFCTIRSPINGRAGARMVDVGNVVRENETPLLSVQRLDTVYADFTVNEQQLPAVRSTMSKGTLKATVRLPAEQQGRDGALTFLDNAVQDTTGTVKLRATLTNDDGYFWPGQFVNVRLVLQTLKDAVLVPSAAPQIGQAGTYVLVVKPDTTAEMRTVVVGQEQGDMTVIAKGVAAGEQVIVQGHLMVRPGGKVMVEQGGAGNPGGAPPSAATTQAAAVSSTSNGSQQ